MKLREILRDDITYIEYRTYLPSGEDVFMGMCEYKDGQLISLDWDSYSLDDEISSYKWDKYGLIVWIVAKF